MPTVEYRITEGEGYLAVAQDAQNVTISFEDGVGQYRIAAKPPSAAPATARRGQYLGLEPASMALSAGEACWVKGSGWLIITADTPLLSES